MVKGPCKFRLVGERDGKLVLLESGKCSRILVETYRSGTTKVLLVRLLIEDEDGSSSSISVSDSTSDILLRR